MTTLDTDTGNTTKTVLCVEDNPANVKLFERVLARLPNTHTLVATDGISGLEMARQERPDLILLDLHLPGMHGMDILRELRGSEDNELRELPIIVVTADLTAGIKRTALAEGADAFVGKPLDVPAFMELVTGMLTQWEDAAASEEAAA